MEWQTPQNCKFERVIESDEMTDPTYHQVYNLPLPDKATVCHDLHVGLIVPPSPFVVPCGWEWVHVAPFEGPSIIASLLKGLGYRVTLLDQREDVDPENLRPFLKDFDLIGITCYEDCYPYLKRAAEIAKEENKDRHVILGGPLVTAVPELMMGDMVADFAIVGEGELTLTELMDYISQNDHAKSIREIKGLVWKNADNQIRVNPKRDQIKNLDVVPMQDFSVWKRFEGQDIPEIYLTYSRGCRGNCSFCFRAFPRLCYKSIQRVRQEILYYKKRNFKMAWWSDLTFVTDLDFISDLMDIALTVHDFRWSCFNRVDTVNPSLFRKMRDRGCDIILYGLESVSPEILNEYRKRINRNKIINAIHVTREAGIKCGGLFIVGAPSETKASLLQLIDFCREFKEITRIKYLALIPGTSNYKDAVKQGIIKDEIAHLHWLAAERSVEEDVDHPGFVMVAEQVTREDLKKTYITVNTMIEQRPYDYNSPANIFLGENNKVEFVKRKALTDHNSMMNTLDND
ncbi:MAG: radical SAM protein [Desulfobacterales bacterium]